MIDLHVHTYFSDGKNSPAVAMRYAKAAGYRAIAFTDHVDASNMRHVLESLLPMVRAYGPYAGIDLFAGVELTHVPAALVPDAIREARGMGAHIVSVHGQTLADIVEEGTNLAAIEGGADILCHPGLITEQEAVLAAERGVLLEITTRPGHALANGHVAATARRCGAKLVINNDAHHSSDFVSRDKRKAIALGAGMTPDEIRQAEENSRALVARLLRHA